MSRFNDCAEDHLIALLQEDCAPAFEEVYRRYHTAIYRNILKLTKDASAAEDLLQDTFITFWQRRATVDAQRSLSGWLFVISYNLSVNWLKRKLVESKAVSYLTTVAPINSEEVADDYDAQMQCIEAAILQLPPQKKRVLELCKLQGRSYKAAAREMNISSHTVKEYLSLAMKSVKKYTASGYKIGMVLLGFWGAR